MHDGDRPLGVEAFTNGGNLAEAHGMIDRGAKDPPPCSEFDNGIADAMNKGLALAKGDFVIFLHSDDYFVDENVLSSAAAHLSAGHEIFLFKIFLSNNGEKRRMWIRTRSSAERASKFSIAF